MIFFGNQIFEIGCFPYFRFKTGKTFVLEINFLKVIIFVCFWFEAKSVTFLQIDSIFGEAQDRRTFLLLRLCLDYKLTLGCQHPDQVGEGIATYFSNK